MSVESGTDRRSKALLQDTKDGNSKKKKNLQQNRILFAPSVLLSFRITILHDAYPKESSGEDKYLL